MDFFGIGGLELIAILVVALLVLGPERLVDVARQAGKWWREAQMAVRTMADAATTKLDEEPKRTAPPRGPVSSPEDAVARASDPAPATEPTDVRPDSRPPSAPDSASRRGTLHAPEPSPANDDLPDGSRPADPDAASRRGTLHAPEPSPGDDDVPTEPPRNG